MNKREIKVLEAAVKLIERVNAPLSSPHLTRLRDDMVDFCAAAEGYERLMKPTVQRSRRLSKRSEQV